MCECSRSLTFAKLLPYAKGLRFVVTKLLVDDLQSVKGRGSIVSVEIIEDNVRNVLLPIRLDPLALMDYPSHDAKIRNFSETNKENRNKLRIKS